MPGLLHVYALLWPAIALRCCVLAQWAPNVAPENRSLDQIYAAAQLEQCRLTVSVGGDAEWAPIVGGFTQRFPNVGLNLTVDLSKYHASRIDRSFYANDEYIDVAVLQTVQNYLQWKAQNRLMFYKPQNFSDIDNDEKDFDGANLPSLLFSFGSFYYEGSKLNQSDLPNTYLDLLDPRWKGKLILTYPNDDDAITYLFSIITSKYGFNWLEGLAQQDVQWVRGTATPAILLGNSSKNSSSQRVLSFTTLGHYTNGPTIKLQAPSLEEYMSWYQRIGIFGSTRCPESSKLFVSWLLSDEYQQTISNSSNTVLNHLNQQSGFNIYASNTTQVGGFPRFMTDRATVEWWRTQFELTLGTAIGPDPNVLY